MEATLKITAQYFENYSDATDPHWKPKGSHAFESLVDSHLLMYVGENDLITACEAILASKSSPIYQYKYISHEISFGNNVTLLNKEEVHEELMKHFD